MNTSKRKGFTLVELLIVIVVIGVLSAMMMLSSTEAVSSARAADIISDLRNLKTATAAWYTDNLDKIQSDGRIKIDTTEKPIQQFEDTVLGISKYMNGDIAVNTKGNGKDIPKGEFAVFDAGDGNRTTWYVGYAFKDGEDKVKEKVKARASSLGLHLTNVSPNKEVNDSGSRVWMKVFGDWSPTTTTN